MKVKFTSDFTFNTDGSAHGRQSARKGEVRTYEAHVCDLLINRWKVAKPFTMTPDETKSPHADMLADHGITDSRQASDEQLLEIKGIGPKTLKEIRSFE